MTLVLTVKSSMEKMQKGVTNMIDNMRAECTTLKVRQLEAEVKLLEEKLKSSKKQENGVKHCDECKVIKADVQKTTLIIQEERTENMLQIEAVTDTLRRKEKEFHAEKESMERIIKILQGETQVLEEVISKKNIMLTEYESRNSELHVKLLEEKDHAHTIRAQATGEQAQYSSYSTVVKSGNKMPEAKQETAIPSILFLGQSQTKYIHPAGMSFENVNVEKHIKYRISEAKDFVESDHDRSRKCVVLHLLGNDLKEEKVTPETCTEDLMELVKVVKQTYGNIPVVISEATPRGDDLSTALKAKQINEVKERTFETKNFEKIRVVRNINMGVRGMPQREMFQDDGVHLTPIGTAKLAGNIKAAVGEILGLRQKGGPYQQKRGFGSQGPQFQRQTDSRRNDWRERAPMRWR
jgi:hypothetical protein